MMKYIIIKNLINNIWNGITGDYNVTSESSPDLIDGIQLNYLANDD